MPTVEFQKEVHGGVKVADKIVEGDEVQGGAKKVVGVDNQGATIGTQEITQTITQGTVAAPLDAMQKDIELELGTEAATELAPITAALKEAEVLPEGEQEAAATEPLEKLKAMVTKYGPAVATVGLAALKGALSGGAPGLVVGLVTSALKEFASSTE